MPKKMGDVIPFKNEAFEPEIIAAMAVAFKKACLTINAQDQSDIVKELLAKRIIAVAKEGHTDALVLYERALRSFGIDVERLDEQGPRAKVGG